MPTSVAEALDRMRQLPMWASGALIAFGILLFFWGSRRSDASKAMGGLDTAMMAAGTVLFFCGLFPLLLQLPNVLPTLK